MPSELFASQAGFRSLYLNNNQFKSVSHAISPQVSIDINNIDIDIDLSDNLIEDIAVMDLDVIRSERSGFK